MRRLLSLILLSSALSQAAAQRGAGLPRPPQTLADTATARAVLVALGRWISDSASSNMPQGEFVMTGDSLPRCINGCPDLTRELRRSLATDFERSMNLK